MYGMLALQRHVLISLLSFLAQNRTERGSDFLVSEVLRKSRLFILTVGTLFHAVDTLATLQALPAGIQRMD